MGFICLHAFDNYIEAHIALGILQEEFINCHLENEHTVTIEPFLSLNRSGIRLMVAVTQAERAAELIKKILFNNQSGNK